MPSGVPLTPAQIETIARVYEETGNASEAARQAGCSIAAAQGAIKRTQSVKRRQLHAQACERGVREARRHLGRVGRLLDRVLSEETGAGVSLEPRDIAALANAVTRNAETRAALAEQVDRKRQSRLTRDKTRLECEYLRARIAGTLPADKIDLIDDRDREANDRRIHELLAEAGVVEALPGETGGADPAPGTAGRGPGTSR